MHDIAAIRKLLTEAFNDDDMKALCFDHFPEVFQQFTTGMTRGQMIQLLLDHCRRRQSMDALLKLVQQERPRLYAEYAEHRESPSQRPPRIVHSLPPAPNFQPRPELDAVRTWWKDETQRGVLALVGAGGAGKTAIARRFLAELPCTPLPDCPKQQDLPSPDALFVWSFYDIPNVEDFFTELLSYLTDQEPNSRRATLFQVQEVLECNVGRVLLVLDGLESMQETTEGNVFGTLRDMPMKQFLRRLADGIGETRVLITSRLPLTDLINYRCAWYKSVEVDLLDAKTARALLRMRGVHGSDQELDAIIEEFGAHAQTLDHLATALVRFCGGIPSRARELPPLEQVKGDVEVEIQARRLGRIFRFYEQQLPAEQITILQHLTVFHKAVDLSTLLQVILRSLQTKEDAVASKLNAQGLREVLYRLRDLRLVYLEQTADGSELVIIHPMIRNHFYRSLGSEATRVSENIRRPLFWRVLDLEEELLRQSLRAGRVQEAFDIYWHRMGSWDYLGLMLGAYARGEAILRSFVASDDPSLIPEGLTEEDQMRFINARGLFLMALGRLTDAVVCFERRLELAKRGHDELVAAAALCNKTDALVKLGRLRDARTSAEEALHCAGKVLIGARYRTSLSWYSYVSALVGDIDAALSGFDKYRELLLTARGERAPLSKIASLHEAEVLLRLGHLEKASIIIQTSKEACEQESELLRLAQCNLALAEIARLQKNPDRAEELVGQALEWGMTTAEQEILVRGYLLQAQLALQRGDLHKVGLVLRRGLDIAEEYGYSLYWIDLKIVEGQYCLVCGEVETAENCARIALAGHRQEFGPHLLGACDPECNYTWGEGDALHLLGQALLAQGQTNEAREALKQAVTVRQRIRDPKVEESRQLLQDVNR